MFWWNSVRSRPRNPVKLWEGIRNTACEKCIRKWRLAKYVFYCCSWRPICPGRTVKARKKKTVDPASLNLWSSTESSGSTLPDLVSQHIFCWEGRACDLRDWMGSEDMRLIVFMALWFFRENNVLRTEAVCVTVKCSLPASLLSSNFPQNKIENSSLKPPG